MFTPEQEARLRQIVREEVRVAYTFDAKEFAAKVSTVATDAAFRAYRDKTQR